MVNAGQLKDFCLSAADGSPADATLAAVKSELPICVKSRHTDGRRSYRSLAHPKISKYITGNFCRPAARRPRICLNIYSKIAVAVTPGIFYGSDKLSVYILAICPGSPRLSIELSFRGGAQADCVFHSVYIFLPESVFIAEQLFQLHHLFGRRDFQR